MVLHSLLPTSPGVAPAWTLLTVVLSLLLRGSLLCASCILLLAAWGQVWWSRGLWAMGGCCFLPCSALWAISCPPCLFSGQCTRPSLLAKPQNPLCCWVPRNQSLLCTGLSKGSFILMAIHHSLTDNREALRPCPRRLYSQASCSSGTLCLNFFTSHIATIICPDPVGLF